MEIADPGLPSDEPSRRERLMLGVCPALALVTPLLEAYGTLAIPLFAWQAAALAGSLAALGLCLGLAAAWLMPSAVHRPLRDGAFCAVLTVSAVAVLDVSAGGHALLMAAAPGSRMARLVVLLAAFSGLAGLFWIVRRRIAPVLFVACLAFFGSTVVKNAGILSAGSGDTLPDALPPARTSAPPFVYLVVDEAMGIEGLRAVPGGHALASELLDLLTRRGFRTHGGAFSRHVVSARSIPNVLNFDFRDDSHGAIVRHEIAGKVKSALFSALAARGYEVISYGTTHIDFCFNETVRCEVLPSFNPLSPFIVGSRLRSRALVQVIWSAFTESYLMYRYGEFLVSLIGEALPSGLTALDTYAFPRWFDRLESDIRANPRGRAYFAHLLMPHAPYVFDETCGETGRFTVAYSLDAHHRLTPAALDAARAAAYKDYLAQYRCLARRLDGLLEQLDRDPRFADATIVIHGDRGSRISAGLDAESLSPRDLVDNYSALYAIRAPGVPPGYDTRMTSIQRLTAEYFSGEPLGPDYPTVAIDSREKGQVRVLPMPVVPADLAGGGSMAPAVTVAENRTR